MLNAIIAGSDGQHGRGSRRWGAVRRVALGSTPERVIRHPQCPILVPPRRVVTGHDAASRAAHDNVLI